MEEDRNREIEINTGSDREEDEEMIIEEVSEEEGIGKGEAGEGTVAMEEHKAKYDELNDKYLRLYAEFDNYKKRVAREKQDLLKFGAESLLLELLTVIDTLELALSHANEDSSNGLRQGIEMTLKEFYRILDKFGIKKLEALGKPFDPTVHEAMSQVVRSDVDNGTVVDEFRKGYLYHDKLLRPSLVAVSKNEDTLNENTKKNEKEERNG